MKRIILKKSTLIIVVLFFSSILISCNYADKNINQTNTSLEYYEYDNINASPTAWHIEYLRTKAIVDNTISKEKTIKVHYGILDRAFSNIFVEGKSSEGLYDNPEITILSSSNLEQEIKFVLYRVIVDDSGSVKKTNEIYSYDDKLGNFFTTDFDYRLENNAYVDKIKSSDYENMNHFYAYHYFDLLPKIGNKIDIVAKLSQEGWNGAYLYNYPKFIRSKIAYTIRFDINQDGNLYINTNENINY